MCNHCVIGKNHLRISTGGDGSISAYPPVELSIYHLSYKSVPPLYSFVIVIMNGNNEFHYHY